MATWKVWWISRRLFSIVLRIHFARIRCNWPISTTENGKDPRRSIATKTTTRRESVLGKPFPFINLSWKGARHRAEEPQFGFESQLRGGPLATPWSIDLENFTWPRDPCLRYCRLSRSIGAAVPFQYQEETKNEIFIVPRRYTVYREINFPHLPWNNSSQEEKFVLGAVCARGTYVLGGFT